MGTITLHSQAESTHNDEGESPDSPDLDVALAQREEVKEPRRYACLLLNDDYSTMEFVIEVLERFFDKSREEALAVMLKVHHEGRGIAGVYSFEIAETKSAQVESLAQSRGFPLKCVVEPA